MTEEIICYCKNVSKETIVKSIKRGADNLKKIQEKTSACTGNKCKKLNPKGRCCSIEILQLLKGHGKSTNKNQCSCNCC